MSRTGLFAALRRTLAAAHAAHRTGRKPEEILAARRARKTQPSRRQFLGGTLAATAAIPLVGCGDDARGVDATVVVVGGGVAGLHCAYRLAEAGVDVLVYESSERTGGRMFTGRGLYPTLNGDPLCELGGELVDTYHVVIQGLCDELGLTLDDLPMETSGLAQDTFFFDGATVPLADLAAEFTPVAATMSAAVTAAEADDGEFARVDGMSIPEWLEGEAGLASTSLIRRVLEEAYVGEYGLEVDEQTIFNLLYLIDYDAPDPFHIFGDSDEVFHIHEGNDAVPGALAESLTADRIRLRHTLDSVTTRDDGLYELGFLAEGGAVNVVCEHVVFALPWTRLREVELADSQLSSEKRMMIDQLGYGTNAKLMLGFDSKPWVSAGANGSTITDNGAQFLWETTRGYDTTAAVLTNFVGGDRGVQIGDGDAEARAAEVVPQVEEIFPGSAAAYVDGSAVRMHWPSHPHTKASYACYRVGQFSFWSLEGQREGNLHFCGEHTSLESQGYMEGGAETGGLVAMEILDDLGIDASARLRGLMSRALARPQATYHAGRWRGEQRRWRRQAWRRIPRSAR